MSKKTCKGYIGQRFGRLVVVSEYRKGKYIRMMVCQCDCGNVKDVYLCNLLKKGHSTSCGCYNLEVAINRLTKHGQSAKGKTTSEYITWSHMRARCYKEWCEDYKNYGGRGIKVCERWLHSFENFLADMGKRPTPQHSLDRFPNVNGNYEPNNCRWATKKQQGGNKRNNRWIEHNGTKMILQDWANKLDVSDASIYIKLRKGQSMEEIIEWSKIRTKKATWKWNRKSVATP